MIRRFEVEVLRSVLVTIDDDEFTEEFLEEFSDFISSSITNLNDHIEHLGWSFAAGRIDNNQFIEGYGQANNFGIKFQEIYDEVLEVIEK